MQTQDPSGGFGYQGTISPNVGALVDQTEIRPSMTAAGSGSLYICARFARHDRTEGQRREDCRPR